jgi:hypothetical protein
MFSEIKYWWLNNKENIKVRLIITGLIVVFVIPWIIGIITCLVLLIK